MESFKIWNKKNKDVKVMENNQKDEDNVKEES